MSKICCFFQNLFINYFTLTAFYSVDKFSNEQQIFGLICLKHSFLLLFVQVTPEQTEGDTKDQIANGEAKVT